ncbi:pyridoxamine 5'-phosphate oxidase family protein [Oceanitalea stevensii]|uniref:Pyridoxamine 5'-phosphate oxidase family protein n=1 Tax=Oceanitalea stevensii TaxID=2763072 RepID=A0ABR8Z2Z7_9MICO|nr:pyridoxamine 5'-phosphate oxidase family protein [Oceanitalea stevensii]MBD8062174.1 pyridoxamine 5'-phosphate oxidase family protein [Oceanitalea stevensii]
MPTTTFDARFSDPDAGPLPWERTLALLRDAELYWFTTVRRDGRPHVTPVVGVWHGEGLCVVTGTGEQKARNLEYADAVTVTTGRNTWASGTDVVVEGHAARVRTGLGDVAAAFLAKYGEAWRFEVEGEGFAAPGGTAWVVRVRPERVIAFAKDPHGQTTYRFAPA